MSGRRPWDLTRLALCGGAAATIYLLAFSLPYSIQAGLAHPLLHLGRITGAAPGPVLGFIAAIAALAALYLLALRICQRLPGDRGALVVVLLFGALGAIVLLPMYPVLSLDIFYYMAADRIWSVYHENPFIVPPLQAAHDPFFPYTTWGHYTLPYGPLWPWISALTSAHGGGLIGPTLLSFKALAVLGYLVCLPLVAWAVGGLRPERRVLGTCIFAWNPMVLLELAGNGHNDAIALIPAIVAVGLWVRRASIGVALGLALSFAVKATSIVLAPLLWSSLRRAHAEGHLVRWVLTHALPALALIVLFWLPFWSDRSSGGLVREAEQYYQSVTAVLMAPVPGAARATVLRIVQAFLFAGYALMLVSELRNLSSENEDGLRASWRLLVFYFAVVAPFSSPWYMIWPTLLAAVLAERRTTLLTTLLCLGGLATYLVQFVVRPLAAARLGWAESNALALLVAYGPFLVGCWITSERFRIRRSVVRPRRALRGIMIRTTIATDAERDA